MRARILCATIISVLFASPLFAQNEKPVRIHEVGITFSSLNAFGLQYKTGRGKTLLRLSLLSLNLADNKQWGQTADSLDIKDHGYGAGFRLGFEKRVPIVQRFDFIWGLEAGCNYSCQKVSYATTYLTTSSSSWYIMPQINLVLGATYTVTDHLVIGAEIAPGFHYAYGKTKSTDANHTSDNPLEVTSSDFGGGFSSNSASLSVAYRFGK